MDPLKPLTTVIRTLWDRTVRRGESANRSGSHSGLAQPRSGSLTGISPINPLRSRLEEKLARRTGWDAAFAREAFVESVLLLELGDELALDPKFMDVVRKVSVQLSTNDRLAARLDSLLKDLRSRTPTSQ